MQGFFDIKLRAAGRLRDEDFLRAREEGVLRALLESLPLLRRIKKQNQVFDMWAADSLWRCFSGPALASPYNKSTGEGKAALAVLAMATTSTPVTDYEETTHWDAQTVHRTTDAVNNTNSGQIIGLTSWSIEPWLARVRPGTNGREQIEYRDRFLYLPSEIVSSAIRSITINSSEEANYNSSGSYTERSRCRLARILLPTVINKANDQTLEVEYYFRLMSL